MESKEKPYGRLRPLYYALKKFFENRLPQLVASLPYSSFPLETELKIMATKPIFEPTDTVSIDIKATINEKPLANKMLKYGFFTEYKWQQEQGEVVTNADGHAKVTCHLPIFHDTGYVIAFARLQKPYTDAYDLKFLKIHFVKDSSSHFYVYKGHFAPLNHFIPSGWIGVPQRLTFDDNYKEHLHSGDSCIRIAYKPSADNSEYSGIYWLNPINNWGTVKGGYNLTGKKALTFWARGENGGEHISQFIAGAIEINKYPDSSTTRLTDINLTKFWKKYRIDLTNADLSYISGGFGFIILTANNPNGCVFYLDNIQYE